MNLDEYSRCDGLALAQLVRSKEITPKELAELAIQGVEKVNSQINAVIEIYDDALDIANQAAGHPGPYAGVPFLRKDIGATDVTEMDETVDAACGQQFHRLNDTFDMSV